MTNIKTALVTGGAGFIGSNLVGRLLELGWKVAALDNFLLGRRQLIQKFFSHPKFRFIKADLLEPAAVRRAVQGHEIIFHLACNSDIQKSTLTTDIDLKLSTLATYNVLESMRRCGVKRIVFSSSSAIMGEPSVFPTPEDYGPLEPVSFYGAGKLAAEGLISAYCHSYQFQAWIYRFANVVGYNGTHGVLVDFIHKLRRNPKELLVLGDGKQAKPYLYVKNCVEGILFGLIHSSKKINVFNLTPPDRLDVASIAKIVISKMGLRTAKIRYTGGDRGWVGDVPRVLLDGNRLKKLGWAPQENSRKAVERAVDDLLGQI